MAAMLLALGCAGGARPGVGGAGQGPLTALFAERSVQTATFGDGRELPQFAPAATVVAFATGTHASGAFLNEPQRAAMLSFVAAGGRLLLFGHAASLATELGIESEWPERTNLRWGFDNRTAIGRARLGWEVVSGRAPQWFEAMTAAADRNHTYFVAAQQPCDVPLCSWSAGAPRTGEVLAVLAVELDGRPGAAGAPIVVRWQHGAGAVVAAGLLPELDNPDETVRDNAAAFVRALVGKAGAAGEAPLYVLHDLPLSSPPLPAETLDLAERELPAASLLAHWGWQAQLAPSDQANDARNFGELVDEVLLPGWQAGADLLELNLVQRERGAPLQWRGDDPLPPPTSWRGAPFWPQWTPRSLGDLAAEAHGRGMLLQAAIDPLPVGERADERLVALRFFARELADVRRLGTHALDGFGVRDWWPDRSGYGASMVQDFHPGAYLYRSGERVPDFAGALRALDADDGAPAGLPFAGLSTQWRDGFGGAQFPLGVLDARARRPAALVQHGEPAGGSAADWLVTQANSFVRARRSQGGALWWRSHDPATLGPQTVAYVHGVCQEPLRAAVAMPLEATGNGGLRAAAASLAGEVQSGFGAEVPVEAAVHVLQNNWLRLVGSGGGLLFDPNGTAQFAPGAATVLSPGLLRTRMFGGRPIGDALRSASLDFLADGSRGAGGYPAVVGVGGARREHAQPPAALAFAAAPQWPQRAEFQFDADTGYHELELVLRGLGGSGLCTVRLNGTLLRCVPFRTGERLANVTVPVHIARGGMRQLSLEVIEGGAVALDRLQLVRRSDVGAEARVDVPAGSVAVLSEASASSYHAESLQFTMLADMPGMLLRVRCERAVRGLQIERTLQLPSYTQLLASSGGEAADRLRGPFVLRSAVAAVPDLVVAPLLLARYDRFRFGAQGLQFHSAPEPGAEARVGLLLVPRRQSTAVMQQAQRMFAALDQPMVLDLGDTGQASLAPQLPVAWTQLLRIEQAARTPFLVCENGWWQWRGAQPAPTGGAWLRVVHLPGDTVQVVGGPALLARTRPGPGSLSLLAMRDVTARSAVVRVLQPSRLVPPAVVFAADFDEVFVDGRPWAHFDGRTVFLPDRVATYRVEVRRHAGQPAPHVCRTAAPLRHCAYEPAARVLTLLVDSDPARPPELPFTAWLSGPRPSRIDNGELVGDDELRFADGEARAKAAAGGVVIRFRSGLTKVHYEK